MAENDITSSPYQSPMHNFGSAILYLTNPESEMHKMELNLRGEIIDNQGKTIKVGAPLMNDRGIRKIIGMVQSVVNQVTIMSNLEKNDIPNIMEFLADTLIKDLMLNKRNYGLKPEDKDDVFFTVLSTAYFTMKRAYKEGDKRFWKGSVQEIRSQVDTGEKKGILGRLTGWGK